jgi:hypothetical protein
MQELHGGIQIRMDKKWELHITLADGTVKVIKARSREELARKIAEVIREEGKQ